MRPAEITSHLKSASHGIAHIVAVQVSEAVQQWENIEHDLAYIELPQVIREPIPEVTVHQDGLLCQHDFPHC